MEEKFKLAHREILIAQSSDWYWWYGKPNESKSDGVFDYLFRRHLMNSYELLDLPIPHYLTMPLANVTARPLRNSVAEISPSLCCDINDDQKEFVETLNLLTSKPVIYATNVCEDDLADEGENNEYVHRVREFASTESAEVVVVCAQIEAEIAELE